MEDQGVFVDSVGLEVFVRSRRVSLELCCRAGINPHDGGSVYLLMLSGKDCFIETLLLRLDLLAQGIKE